MDSFQARELKRKKFGPIDYDKEVSDEIQYVSGTNFGGGVAVEVESDDHLYEPQKDDQEFNEYSWNQGAGALSYSKVKRHQYKFHPRDREQKQKFAPFGADIKFFPISQCQIKKDDWVTKCAREIGLGPTLFILT